MSLLEQVYFLASILLLSAAFVHFTELKIQVSFSVSKIY